MKDWKQKLQDMKSKTAFNSENNAGRGITQPLETKEQSITGSSREELEEKIINLFNDFEDTSKRLSEIQTFPLIAGNSKNIKRFQNSIKVFINEIRPLLFKHTPDLPENISQIEIEAICKKIRSRFIEKQENIQKELEEAKLREATEKLKEQALQKQKEIAEKKAALAEEKNRQKILAKQTRDLIKLCSINKCEKCKSGSVAEYCEKCHDGRLNTPYKTSISERFICSNLKPTCPFCFGSGTFTKEKEVMSYLCPNCINGKILVKCETCNGTQLMSGNGNTFPKQEFLDLIDSDSELLQSVKNAVLNR
jgi:hypothetical protein